MRTQTQQYKHTEKGGVQVDHGGGGDGEPLGVLSIG